MTITTINSATPSASVVTTSAVGSSAAAAAVPAEPYDDSSTSGPEEIDDLVELPTIQLTDLDEEMGIVPEDISALRGQSTLAVAESIVTSVREVDVEGGSSTRQMDFSNVRAEFISVTFYKEHPNLSLGICLFASEVRISTLTEGSMAADSPLRPGDKILSVNNKDCASSKLTSKDVGKILRESFGDVTLIIHNEGGASDLVESMIMKSDPKQSAGIAIRQDRNGIAIARLHDGSKFKHSLLNGGDIVLSINGAAVTHLKPNAVADMIKNAPRKVTVLARTQRETGVVVAQLSESYLRTNHDVPVLTANGTTRQSAANNNTRPTTTSTTNNRPTNNNTNSNEMDENEKMQQCGLFLVVGVVVIVGIVVAVSSSAEDSGY